MRRQRTWRSGGSPRRQDGATLIGILLGLAIGTLILTAALSIYLMISRTARENVQQARLNQELRAAIEVMQQELRRAGSWDFADANGDGDATGDGAFDWRDLGTTEDGEGRFDSNRDGQTDERDLDPIHNPFQRRFGTLNNDLCIGTDALSGACAAAGCAAHNDAGACLTQIQRGNCVTFSYDLDLDARIGIRACDAADDEDECPRPTKPPFNTALHEPYAWRSWYPPDRTSKTKNIEMEMFGFRLNRNSLQMRVGRTDKNDDRFGCNSGRWEAITSPDIRITGLDFTLTTRIANTNPRKRVTDTCVSGDLCRHSRALGILLTGQLAEDPETRQTLETHISVRNDRYEAIP